MESHTMLRRSPVAPDAGRGGEDELRSRLRQMWAAVAPAWSEHAEYADARGTEMAERMLAATSPGPGDRVLELACGPGGVGLAAAERVAPEGSVVLSDFVAEMVSVAAARAAARALHNVTTRRLDLEEIEEPDGSFDVVLCREGLMFAPDPARAAQEVARVLRPRGRFAVTVWGPPESNPWLTVVFDAVGAVTGKTVPPTGVPGPFSLADRDRLGSLFRSALVADVLVTDVPVPLQAPTFTVWWERTCALAGPLAKILQSLPEQTRQAIRTRAEAAARAYETPEGLELPGVALLVTGTRA